MRRFIIPAIVVLSLALLAGAGVTTALIANKAQAENTPPEAPIAVASTPAVSIPAVARSIQSGPGSQPNPESDIVTNRQPPQPDAPSVPGLPNVSDSGQYPVPEKHKPAYPNLGSHLDRLVASVEAGETTAEEAAKGAAVHNGASVAVTIHLSGNVDDVVSFLEDNGGDPRNVGGDYIEAYVPVTLLGPASEQPGVIRVREVVPPEPGQGG